jgi:hypothetical protein
MSNGHHIRNNQKRMRGRHNNNHRKSQNPLTRLFESNGPDVKIRGTASHIAEKYIQLARDSQSSGDPVAAENYYQHAEHYFRLIAAAQEQFRQQNPYYNNQQPQQGGAPQGASDDNYDDDVDDQQPLPGQNEPHAPRDQGQPYMPREAQQQQQPYPPRDQQPQPQQGGRPPQQQNYQPRHQQGGGQGNQPPAEGNEVGGLPSFITGGGQNPAPDQQQGGNGHDQYDRGPNRFGRHRRRHRGPRNDMQGGQPNQQYNQTGASGGGNAPSNEGGDEPPLPPRQPGE